MLVETSGTFLDRSRQVIFRHEDGKINSFQFPGIIAGSFFEDSGKIYGKLAWIAIGKFAAHITSITPDKTLYRSSFLASDNYAPLPPENPYITQPQIGFAYPSDAYETRMTDYPSREEFRFSNKLTYRHNFISGQALEALGFFGASIPNYFEKEVPGDLQPLIIPGFTALLPKILSVILSFTRNPDYSHLSASDLYLFGVYPSQTTSTTHPAVVGRVTNTLIDQGFGVYQSTFELGPGEQPCDIPITVDPQFRDTGYFCMSHPEYNTLMTRFPQMNQNINITNNLLRESL